jgi:hypothetical protein
MMYVLRNFHFSFTRMMCLMFRTVEELGKHWVFGDEQKV